MACAQVMNDSDLARFRTKSCQRHLSGACEFNGRCQYSHCENQHRRRCPFLLLNKEPLAVLRYIPILCEDIETQCYRGVGCPFARMWGSLCLYGSHSAFATLLDSEEEIFFHPLIYKQKLCSKYHRRGSHNDNCTTSFSILNYYKAGCEEYYCPFVHDPKEKRDISNFFYFLAPSFSKKLSVFIPQPISSIPVSTINTSKLSNVSLKETPWLSRLILLNPPNDSNSNRSSISPSMYEYSNLFTPALSSSESQQFEMNVQNAEPLHISRDKIKVGCLYLAAAFLTERDIQLPDSPLFSESSPSEPAEASAFRPNIKALDTSECPTLLNKVFINNFRSSIQTKYADIPILWVTPGTVILLLYWEKESTKTSDPLNSKSQELSLGGTFGCLKDMLPTVNHNSSDMAEWAYGRCVSGKMKGKEGWFPISLCFGIHQDDNWSPLELRVTSVPRTIADSNFVNTLLTGKYLIEDGTSSIPVSSVSSSMNYSTKHRSAEAVSSSLPSLDTENTLSGSSLFNFSDEEHNNCGTVMDSAEFSSSHYPSIRGTALHVEDNTMLTMIASMESLQERLFGIQDEIRCLLIDELCATLSGTDHSQENACEDISGKKTDWGLLVAALCNRELMKRTVQDLLGLLNHLETVCSVRKFGNYEGGELIHLAKAVVTDTYTANPRRIKQTMQPTSAKNDIVPLAYDNSVKTRDQWVSSLNAYLHKHGRGKDVQSQPCRSDGSLFSTHNTWDKLTKDASMQEEEASFNTNPFTDLFHLGTVERTRESGRTDSKNYTKRTKESPLEALGFLTDNNQSVNDTYDSTVTPSHNGRTPYYINTSLSELENSFIPSFYQSIDSASTTDCTDSGYGKYLSNDGDVPQRSEMSIFGNETPFPSCFSSTLPLNLMA